jgi:hypothetical protein
VDLLTPRHPARGDRLFPPYTSCPQYQLRGVQPPCTSATTPDRPNCFPVSNLASDYPGRGSNKGGMRASNTPRPISGARRPGRNPAQPQPPTRSAPSVRPFGKARSPRQRVAVRLGVRSFEHSLSAGNFCPLRAASPFRLCPPSPPRPAAPLANKFPRPQWVAARVRARSPKPL